MGSSDIRLFDLVLFLQLCLAVLKTTGHCMFLNVVNAVGNLVTVQQKKH